MDELLKETESSSCFNVSFCFLLIRGICNDLFKTNSVNTICKICQK